MRTRSKAIVAGIAATLMLTLALGSTSATARNFRLSEREFEILFNRGLTFEAAGTNISCPMTFLGHFFESTLPKVLNSKVGVIRHVEPSSAREPPCTGGAITILRETLPWSYNYAGFTGRLPLIQTIRYNLIGIAFRIGDTSNGLSCLAGTTAREPAAAEQSIGTGGRVESFRVEERTTIRLGGGFLCEIAGSSRFIGTGTILDLPGTSSITVALI